MSVRLYGLNNCDTCKKARKWLDRREIAHEFIDYRDNPLPASTLVKWAESLGGFDKLVNRSSTTWRGLLESRKNPHTAAEWTLLIKEYPALVRRPVTLTSADAVSVGFSDKLFSTLFA